MHLKTKLIKENKDGSAIVELDLDRQAKDWLIGEGFLYVLSTALGMSKSCVKPKGRKNDR
jgi:hypothetical protein